MTRSLSAAVLTAILFFSGAQAFGAQWLDQSPEVFLNKKMNAIATRYREFPVFWWNFVSLEGNFSREDGEKICNGLQANWGTKVAKLPCNFTPEKLTELTHDWLGDLQRRRPVPSQAEWQASMNGILAKAGMPLPRALLELMRADPTGSLSELKKRLDQRQPFDLPMRGGMITDGKQLWIPVQFNYSPADTVATRELNAGLQKVCSGQATCEGAFAFGPHFSHLENEQRIRDDINVVSIVGTLSLIALAIFVVITNRWRLVLLMPILLLGLALAAGVTVAVFGKIHGITLAFGPGIVGLAMDYGVHAVFMDPRSKSTWKSNLAGLLTTLVILLILIFSQIPLLRQMMFFSAVGLIMSFGLFYGALHAWPQIFETKPYGFTPKTWRAGEWFAIALLAASPLLVLRPPDLSIQHLNYESPKTVQMRNWFGKHTTSLQPYWLEEGAEDPLTASHVTRAWAESENIPYEGAANFLPPEETQKQNLNGWQDLCKAPPVFKFSEIQERFFAPFFTKFECQIAAPRDLKSESPDYLKDFTAQGQWASLLFPVTGEQVAKVKNRFPAATTPREIFSEFPKIFMQELLWMVPVAFLLALVFLYFHFRRVRFTLLSTVPFLTGVGCYAIVAVAFRLPLSFISLIGLLMVFGFSLDYGIFVVDLMREHNENKYGVWSALSVCSFSAVAGFAPLVFAGHPVLNDLGQTLLWGSLGTFIGTFWGIPGLYRRFFE